MRQYYILFFFLTIFTRGFAQQMEISGNVQDTNAGAPLRFAVAMAVKLSDSVLVKFTRTGNSGNFILKALPVDTYVVIISHPNFGDQTFLVAGSSGSSQFDFGKIVLPPKNVSLQEVVVFAFKDPVYFKGDTLVYTADSFKVKPNATVEDLLKKLPGIQVDEQGKITAQGKKIDQVLVDGDEFFGSDPTIATRNLNATSVESVQVYEKKNENAAEGGEETIKVMDLTLKEDAKKGYFGKISGAGGSSSYKPDERHDFFEGELLMNKFKGKQKISAFGLGSNTPKTGFNWQDSYKFGITEEMNAVYTDDGEGFYYMNSNKNTGIPETYRAGVYYTDRLFSKTKVNLNYSYSTSRVRSPVETATQYLLKDSTYFTENRSDDTRKGETHSVNALLDHSLDSVTSIMLKPRLRLSLADHSNFDSTRFYGKDTALSHHTVSLNKNNANNLWFENTSGITRRFAKKGRLVVLRHILKYEDRTASDSLISANSALGESESIFQQKTSKTVYQSQQAYGTFTEPLSARMKLELGYDFFYSVNSGDNKALDLDSSGSGYENPVYSNAFKNIRDIHRPGVKSIYETRKLRFESGFRVMVMHEKNANLSNDINRYQNANAFLPALRFRYKLSDNSSFDARYSASSRQPDFQQLQPLPDNTDPNRILVGNPDLRSSYSHRANISYYSYKPISNRNFWGSAFFTSTRNQIVNSTVYDNFGRAYSTYVNVNGNYTASAQASASIPLIGKLFTIRPGCQASYSNIHNFINGEENITLNASGKIEFGAGVNTEKLDLSAGTAWEYYHPSSGIGSLNTEPYFTQRYNGNIRLDLPAKLLLTSSFSYFINGNRAPGYNINYAVWNASFGKRFLKTENLILTIDAYDLLNQNIRAERTVSDNRIMDTKADVVRRYVLFRALLKFNSSKTKEEENDFY